MASGTINRQGATFDLLWTNPSPSSSFGAQTISLDLSEYDAIMAFCLTGTGTYSNTSSDFILVGGAKTILIAVASSTNYKKRSIKATSTGVTFGSGYVGTDANNEHAIPYKIYGVKGIPI